MSSHQERKKAEKHKNLGVLRFSGDNLICSTPLRLIPENHPENKTNFSQFRT